MLFDVFEENVYCMAVFRCVAKKNIFTTKIVTHESEPTFATELGRGWLARAAAAAGFICAIITIKLILSAEDELACVNQLNSCRKKQRALQ